MFLYIMQTIGLILICYGVYSFIMLIFELKDSKRYRRCAYIDEAKVGDVEDAVYTVILRNPDTEIFIVYHNDTSDDTKNIINALAKKYDIVYSIEDR